MPHDIKAVNFTGSLSIQAAAADSKKTGNLLNGSLHRRCTETIPLGIPGCG